MAAVETRMEWRPATCRCVIEYALSRTDDDLSTTVATPDVIFEQCEAHAAATTAEELEALIAPENEALAKAYATIKNVAFVNERTISEDYTALLSWKIEPNESAVREVHITVREADVTLQTALNAIDLIVPTYSSTPGENGEREVYQETREARTEQNRVLQGVRQYYAGTHQQDEAYADYFNICGNAIHAIYSVSYFPENYVDTQDVSHYKTQRHRIDFDMSADRFSVRVDAHINTADFATQFAMFRNQLPSVQWVHVPANRMGVFTCIGDAESFVAGDYVTGYRQSLAIDEFTETRLVNSRMVTWEMLPTTGRHSIFKVGGEPGFIENNGVPGNAYASYPLTGSLAHYNTTITQEVSTAVADGELPVEALLRAPGTLSYFQGAADPSDDRGAIVGTRLNDHPADLDWDVAPLIPYWVLQAADPDDQIRSLLDDSREADVESGDLFGSIGADQPVGSGSVNTVWGVGINWQGDSSSSLIDHHVGEAWVDSFDNVDGDRVDKFNFSRFNPYESAYDRNWYASAIGEFHPRTQQEVEAMPLHWLDIEAITSFVVGISRIRAYLDTHSLGEGEAIRVGIAQRHGAIGDLAVDVGETTHAVGDGYDGWYEDNLNSDEVQAGTGFCLRFAAELASTTAKAHISTVLFSYRPAPDNRECLVRILPEATAVEPLGNLVRLARSVKIIPEDGEVFAYTEHDRDITYDVGDGGGSVVYKSCGGFEGSASELGSILGEVGNMEVRGFASALGLTVDDLFGGRFDGAIAEVWLLPWGEGNEEPARRHGGGVFGPVKQKDRTYTLEALSWSEYLKRRSLLGIYTPTCRHKLGAIPEGAVTGCGVDLECMRVSGTVTAIEDAIPNGARVRLTFYDTSRTEESGWFAEGEIEFLTGANTGQVRTVKYSKPSTGEITVWEPLIYPVEVGDTYTMLPGCDKTKRTCIDKFNNLVNAVRGGFGGFSTIPGLDATSQTPSGRSGE